MSGFGLLPLKAEGYDNGDKFGSDDRYLRQLQAYADWCGVEETKRTQCSRPWLLDKLIERPKP